MKRILILITIVFFAINSFAEVITAEQAKQIAAKSINLKRTANISSANALTLAYTAISKADATAGEADFYVFNKAGNEGFVIVAADNVAENIILGYTDEGSFDYESAPENMKWWLSEYSSQINFLRTKEKTLATAKEVMPKGSLPKSAAPTPVVAPLLGELLWNQTDPYNRMCPEKNGERCVTGCGATSMSQVMYYHKWPLKGKGSKSYSWNNQTLSVNFSQAEYRWDQMLSKYTDGFTEDQANAVAQLAYHCGVSISMKYDPEGSAAYESSINTALKNYFYYTAKYANRYNYTATNWEKLVKADLNNALPVLYAGQGDDGGHAFVCDGYDSNGYYHFNFGWGGSGNGYYTLSTAKEFPTSQEMTYNIKPSSKTDNIVDGLYYNILGDSAVEVTYPASLSAYSGDIVIPGSVVIDDAQYNVVRIGETAFNSTNVASVTIPQSVEYIAANAFSNCSKLTSVTVLNESPLMMNALMFDNGTYSTATLNVPEGKVADYSIVAPWMMFSKITDGKDSVAYSAWVEGSETGTAVYTSCLSIQDESETLPIYMRTSLADENMVQYKVDNIFSNSFLFNMDKTTNKCTMPKQQVGYVNSNRQVYVSDYPTYNPYYTYEKYPLTFDDEIGLFKLMVYYHTSSGAIGSGTDKVQLPGYPSYEISIDEVSCSESGLMTAKVTKSADLDRFAYITVSGNISKTEASQYAEKIASGEITAEYTSSTTFTKQIDAPDNYTLVVVSLTPSGNLFAFASASFKYESTKEPEWVEKYEGTYKYSVWEKKTVNNVIAYQDKNNKNSWKLTPMYGNTEFFFSWNTTTGLVEFDEQETAFVESKAAVTVNDYKNVVSSADASYYNESKKALYFNTYYIGGKWKEKGFETYTITKDLDPEGLKGDANGDDKIDVADITAIASYILGSAPEGFNADNADVNSDGKIDVADITGTAAIILGN